MSNIDTEMDEEMYHETTILTRRHLSDEVLRVPIKHCKPPEAIVVQPDAALFEVVRKMREGKQGAVIVSAGDHKPVGIFTERDLLYKAAGRDWNFREHRITEVMTENPMCLTPRDKIGFALNWMMTKGYRHIPVYDDGQPPWMLSVRHILMFLCEHFPEDIINLPPDTQVPATRDGG